MADKDAEEQRNIAQEFKSVVNMTRTELRSWLATEDSQAVGMTAKGKKVTGPEGPEAVGHIMGHRIVELLAKKKADLDSDDYAAMQKVVGYVHRHIKQRPQDDITETRWRKSLMNWGHDPLK